MPLFNPPVIGTSLITASGTNDNVAIQAAIDALPSTGGTVTLNPGTYSFSTAGVVITDNKAIAIYGYGAVVNLPASGTSFKINQGNINALGVTIEGVKIDGQSNASTVGIEFEDTNNPTLRNVTIENCAKALLFDSQDAGGYVEGTLLDNVVLRENTVGLSYTITSGTGSFAQSIIRGLRCVIGASGKGIDLDQNCDLVRSYIQATFWLGTDETALDLDGDIDGSVFQIAVEGAAASTGNTSFLFGANLENLDGATIEYWPTGTIATAISNGSTKSGAIMHRGISAAQIDRQTTGSQVAAFSVRKAGDANPRIQLDPLTAGGRVQFGAGSATPDANLYRNAANQLKTDDQLWVVDGVSTKAVAGAVSDASFTVDPPIGTIAVDTTNLAIYVKTAENTWKSVTVA